MIRTIIVDDETRARQMLRAQLEEFIPSINIVDEASSAEEAKKKILEHEPDLVFLDVEMPHGDGFSLLRSLNEINFEVIFTTAHNDYAIDALKHSALDYLLKPIDPELLEESIERFAKKTERIKRDGSEVFVIPDSQLNINQQHNKIALPIHKGFKIVTLLDIIVLKAGGSYSNIVIKNDGELVVTKNLKHFEEILHPFGFVRVHDSYLVNGRHIASFTRNHGSGGSVTLTNEEIIPVSRGRKSALLDYFLMKG
jgi:two-component system LytT family response regulator